MNILFIQPPRVIARQNMWARINPQLPSLGLACVASYAERRGHEVKILDLSVEPMPLEQVPGYVKSCAPDIVGITANTILLSNALALADCARSARPDAKIVLGGVHPTIFPEEVLKRASVDYVVRHEGELTLAELADGAAPESIAGLSYRAGGEMRHNAPRERIKNLDEMPYPAYHLLPMKKYRPSLGNYKRLPAASIMTSRGCPGRCTFCYTGVHGRQIRFRSAENILGEIKLLVKDHGIREICFYDDTFTANRPNVMRLCELLIRGGVDIAWTCMSRVDCMDRDVLALMKRAGCHQIGYGVESVDEEILGNIKKRINLEDVRRVIKLTRECAIDARAMFMFGNPGETEETMRRTLDFAMRLKPDFAVFNIATPYPGTEMYAWAKETGRLLTQDWDRYDRAHGVRRLDGLAPERIEEFYRQAYKKFYRSPAYIAGKLFKMRTWTDLLKNSKALASLLLKRD